MGDYIEAKNLKEVRKTMMTCTYCGFCKSVCPVFEGIGWDSSVARGRMILSYGLLQKDIPADESVVENLYQCTTCKDCERRCPSNIEVVDVVERARKDLVAAGKMLPKHRAVVGNVLKYGNPYGEKVGVPMTLGREPKRSELGYFVGCTAAYRNKSTSSATLSILDKIGEDFTVIDEVCCGSVLQRIGVDEETVDGIMEKNVQAMSDLGLDEVVLSCAGCYHMFKEEYPKHVKVPFKVKHISEHLAERDLKLRPSKGVITYHDPCHLGRHSGVYEAPRDVLRKIPGTELKEMPRNRSTARCCGGGGGVRSAYPDLSSKIAAKRVDEARFADLLVTSCPFCVNNLNVGKQATGSKVEIIDLVELVDSLMEE